MARGGPRGWDDRECARTCGRATRHFPFLAEVSAAHGRAGLAAQAAVEGLDPVAHGMFGCRVFPVGTRIPAGGNPDGPDDRFGGVMDWLIVDVRREAGSPGNTTGANGFQARFIGACGGFGGARRGPGR